MMKRGKMWVPYYAQMVAGELIGASDDERRRFFDTMQKAFLTGERGLNKCADFMLDERDAFLAKSSEGGKKGVPNRWPGKHPLNTPSTPPVDAPNTPPTLLHDTDRTKHKRKRKPTVENPDTDTRDTAPEAGGDAEGGGSVGQSLKGEGENGGGSGDGGATIKDPRPEANANPAIDAFRKSKDKGRMLRAATPESVVACMIDYCGESNPKAALRGYLKEWRRLGEANFKNACAEFVEGLESGVETEPGNRGAALMARLKDAAPGADGSMRRRGGLSLHGIGGPGDVTIRGVRVANKGDGLGDVGF